MQENKNIFVITEEDIQAEAINYLGREISEEEMQIVKKGLDNGIMTTIDAIYQTIFEDIVSLDNKN